MMISWVRIDKEALRAEYYQKLKFFVI